MSLNQRRQARPQALPAAGPSSQPWSSDDDFAQEARKDAEIYKKSRGEKPAKKKKNREESRREYQAGIVALCKLLGEWVVTWHGNMCHFL